MTPSGLSKRSLIFFANSGFVLPERRTQSRLRCIVMKPPLFTLWSIKKAKGVQTFFN
jgi:hypothetical protein